MSNQISHEEAQKSQRRRLILQLVVLLIVGALCTWWLVIRADHKMREDLLNRTRLVARAVNLEHIQALSGTTADLESPMYLRLKEQFANIRAAEQKCRFVYLMGQKPAGSVYFFADSEPVGGEDESPAGQVYEEIPEEYLHAFAAKTELVDGPVADRWGMWISALVPLNDPQSGELIAMLGMDIDAHDWKWAVAGRSALPVSLLVLLITGLGVMLTVSGRAKPSVKPVLHRLLPVGSMLMFLLFVLAGALLYHQHQEQMNARTALAATEVQADLQLLMKQQARGLATALHTIALDDRALQGLKSGDRVRLLANCHELYETLHNEQDLTHFYFFDVDRVCLLRVHNPQKFGDSIDRFTAIEAERTGKTAYGIELGPLGTFTLRAVMPVFDGPTLLGYVELGKEVEDALQTIHSNLPGVELAVTIYKDALMREEWEAGMRMLGREAEWDRLSHNVIIYASQGHLSDAFARFADHDLATGHDHDANDREVVDGNRVWRVIIMPLKDASGNEVGHLHTMNDISELKATFHRNMTLGAAVGLTLLTALLALVYVMLSRTDAGIRAQGKVLRESEKKYRSIFDSIQDVYVEIGFDGTIIEITESIKEASGYSRPEILGTQIGGYFVSTEDQKVLMSKLAAKGYLTDHEVLLKHKDETIRVCSLSLRIGSNSEGKPMKVVGNMRDITVRKRMETALKTSEERLDLALQVANDGVWDWDLRDNSVFFDTRYYTMAGYEPDEFPSTFDEWEKRIHPDDLDRTKAAISRYRYGETDTYEEEFKFLHKNGTYMWILARGRAVELTEDELPLRIVGTHSDISARKLSEQNTLQARKRAETILSVVQSGVLLVDAVTHEIVEANPAALKMSGFTHEEIVGHRCHSLICSHQEGACPITELGENVDNRETSLQTKSGEPKTVIKDVTEITLNGRLYLLESFVDISDLKAIEANLRESNSAKEKLFSIIAHDLRGPVGTQLGFIEMVNEDFEAFDAAEIKEIFRNLEISTNKLYTLLNNLLSWSRLQSGGIKTERQLSDVASLCEDVKSQSSVQSSAKGINVSMINKEKVVANIDPSLMEIVLRNLLSNAIKFSAEGSSIEIALDSEDGFFKVEIQDHGTGIPADKLAEIFSPSNKYRQIGTAGEPTSGLGLPLAKEYVELNGGTIEVQSELGVGTTFIVRIPKPSDGQ